jgi:acyl-coenzyme A synthetase/AMP-(fatty) acid ligase
MAEPIPTLWEALERTARERGDAPAFLKGERKVSFSEWRAQSVGWARHLSRLGVRPGERVLLWMEPSPDAAAALFGAWGAGATVALLDARSGDRQRDDAIGQIDPRAVVVSDRQPWEDAFGADAPELIDPKGIEAAGGPPPRRPLATEAASIIFTSGSTGRPKGVLQPHANLALGSAILAHYQGIGADDRILCPVPWAFDYGFIQLQLSAYTGATQILPTAPTTTAACEALERHRPTLLPGIPAVFAQLLHGLSSFRTIDRSSIRTVTSTGGMMPAPLLAELRELMPRATFVLNYGLTESYRSGYLPPADLDTKPGRLGIAIPGVQLLVLREDGSEASDGEEGDLIHRGPLLFDGYWGDAEATAHALRRDPLAPAGRPNAPPVLFTGDRAVREADGYLSYRGRRDRQIKTMGVRVSPLEVEEALHASGLVAEVAVFAIPHEMLGEEICAAVVARPGIEKLRSRIAQFARGALSPYTTPRRVIEHAELPRTANGKVDYQRLRREAIGEEDAP